MDNAVVQFYDGSANKSPDEYRDLYDVTATGDPGLDLLPCYLKIDQAESNTKWRHIKGAGNQGEVGSGWDGIRTTGQSICLSIVVAKFQAGPGGKEFTKAALLHIGDWKNEKVRKFLDTYVDEDTYVAIGGRVMYKADMENVAKMALLQPVDIPGSKGSKFMRGAVDVEPINSFVRNNGKGPAKGAWVYGSRNDMDPAFGMRKDGGFGTIGGPLPADQAAQDKLPV